MNIDHDFIVRSNPRTHSLAYPPSYYAETADTQPPYPPLAGRLHADVCVIGGGFSGVNVSLELGEAGFSTILLEARRIGWGASGRNGGQVLRGIGPGASRDPRLLSAEDMKALRVMDDESVAIVVERIKRYNIQCDLKRGSAQVALKPRHIDALKEQLEELNTNDYPHTADLDTNQLGKVTGSQRYIAALTLGGDVHVHPLKLCLSEAKAAVASGVRIFEESPASAIEEGTTHCVKTARGSVRANFVVMCGNAYSANMHRRIARKIMPASSYIIATEPLGSALSEEILPSDVAVCDLNYALDYFRLSSDKRLLFGGLCNYSARDPRDIVAVLRPRMLRVFPQLKHVAIDYQWGGMIGVGLNRFPQIGRVSPTLYYAQGYAGHGINVSHMAARIVAESIRQQTTRIDIFEQIKHRNFPGGQALRPWLFALGMMFYRLRDRL